MSEKNWDKIIHHKLADHESRVPSDMWSRIVGDMQKKRRLPFYPFLLAAIATLITGMLYFQRNEDNSKADSKHALEHTIAHTDTDDRQDVATSTTEAEIDTKQNMRFKMADHSKTQNNTSDQTQKNNEIDQPIGDNMSYVDPAKYDEFDDQNISQTSSSKQSVDRGADHTPSDITRSSASNISSTLDNNSDVMNTSSTSTSENNKTLDENNFNTSTDNSQNTIDSDTGNSMAFRGENDANKKYEQINSLDESNSSKSSLVKTLALNGKGQSLSHGHLVYDPCTVKGGKKKQRVHCYSYVQQNKLTFADFTLGPQYSHKFLKLKSGDIGQDVLTDRENTESYMLSYQANARLGIKLPSGLTGMAGVSYDRYNERFDYFNPAEQLPIETTVIVVAGGDSTVSISIEAIGEHTVKHTNTMSFVSVPLTAAYTWQGDKLNVGVHGGMAVNLLFLKSGRIVNEEGLQSLNSTVRKETYKTSAGFNLTGGLIFEYKIDRDISFIAEPRFSYNLRSLTTDGYPIDQKYLTAGINFGIRKILYERVTHKKKYGVN